MKKIIHRAGERGKGEHGWLHTRYSFSFADWYDASRMGFGVLRVLNDDVIEPNSEFAPHSHANMEIITIVTSGVVSHKDSMGNTYDILAGDVQVMSAGTGVTHSESNNSSDQKLALFQIWIEPRIQNILPSYSQKSFGLDKSKNNLELLVAPEATVNMLAINQNAYVYYGDFQKYQTLNYAVRGRENGIYVFVVSGKITVEGEKLDTRDAIGVWELEATDIVFEEHSKILLFEVPMK